MAGTCAALSDPARGCPDAAPKLTESCTGGAICDYDICGNGCIETYFCEDAGTTWSGAVTVCGGSCEGPSSLALPWEETQTLKFGRLGGDCGPLGSLSYDPSKGTFGALACELVADDYDGCAYHRKMVCMAGDSSVTLEMRVAFRTGRGYRGEATLDTEGASVCHGSYALAL